MKHADFHIGLEFVGSAGFRWRCTDVGTRTILAIPLDCKDPLWYQGPPYIAKEKVFDEHEIKRCHLTETDALTAAVREHKTSGHPGYPNEVVAHMLKARHQDKGGRYPHEGVLRFDRCRPDGEILHPYAGRKEGDAWVVELYLPFLNTYDEMAELDFIALPIASANDIRVRADLR
ncbi:MULTISPECIES: hypothetical protein [unclassified Dyella]|uniref:hypothetical protein n=1 Tax=Dyella sp. ASV21 TaxID=2795114 RepID=UPI0018EAB521